VNYDKSPPLLEEQAPHYQQGDILDEGRLLDVMGSFEADAVVHLAARTDLNGTTLEDYRENTEGTRKVLEVSAQVPSVSRVVVASTMYVCRRGYVPRADDDYAPDTVYGESKVETEEIARRSQWPFDWAIVRPAVIWGPYHERLRREFFKILSLGLYFHPGKTRTRRSYGYVENTAWQLLRMLEVNKEEVAGKTFYLADPPLDLYEWVNECSRQLRGREVRSIPMPFLRGVARFGDLLKSAGMQRFPLTSFRLANMTTDWTVDTGPIEAVAGAVPITIEEGVGRTVEWLRAGR
jgi:nucleoside-diphosphate-sugar epimerase